MQKNRPQTSAQNCNLVVECMRCLVWTKLHETHKKEVSAMTYLWDAVLSTVLQTMRTDGLPISDFWHVRREILALVLNPGDADRSCGKIKEHVNRAVASSKLGHLLFAACVAHVLAGEVKDIIESGVEKLKVGKITQQKYTQITEAMVAEIAKL